MSTWIRSSACSVGTCVEVLHVDGHVEVRDNTAPDTFLSITPADWAAFLVGAKAGEFDGPAADTAQARESIAESHCLCGPDLTGECIDSRPDCPRHGYDYSVSGMVTAPELARAWWDSLEGDRPSWESLDHSAQAGYVELAAKWIQRAEQGTS